MENTMTNQSTHLDKIRERFTATADVFAQNVRVTRKAEAERLAKCAIEDLASPAEAIAIDLACGPGTFTRPLAARVRRAIGVDLTPAMVEKARAEAAREGISNIEFVCSDVYALPFAIGAADIVSCGYAFHHMTDPARAIAEMTRVARPGGRMAIIDIIVPEGFDPELQNAIERERDPSHTNTLTVARFRAMFRDAGLHVRSEDVHENVHDFDAWMRNAGSAPGDDIYARTRKRMEKSMSADASGFRPHISGSDGAGIEFTHTVLLIVGEKPE
jgi:ubiquinone/menaquinone biosynthesis C-methylase UbiE